MSSPGQINLEFSRAGSHEKGYRLEFFDHYTEWDLTRIAFHDEKSIPRNIVDILIDDPSFEPSIRGISTHSLDRVLDAVSDQDGFSLEGALVTTLAAGKNFLLTPGRSLYTGLLPARLNYSTLSAPGGQEILLKPHTRYTFDESLSGSLMSGRIYFFDTLSSTKTLYTDALIGMPLLSGMKMRNMNGKFRIRDTNTNNTTEIAL